MAPQSPPRTIRPAEPHEAGMLADLQNRSSTHWGYPPNFFDWAPDAHVIPDAYVRDNPVYVLEEDGRAVGFYGFTIEDGELLLDKLFVDIDRIGTGCGKTLWRHAVETARQLGHERFVIGSDPNAASFYRAMGAKWYAEKPTASPEWTVQMFRYRLTPEPDVPAGKDRPQGASTVLHRLWQGASVSRPLCRVGLAGTAVSTILPRAGGIDGVPLRA